MEYALYGFFRVLILVLGGGVSLYILWKLAEAIDDFVRNRRIRRRKEVGGGGRCRYGVDSSGNITRMYVGLRKD